jgi:hypothetical protein
MSDRIRAVVALMGVVLAFNLWRSAERLAAFSRTVPWWLKGLRSDAPATHRVVGVAFMIWAAILIGIGVSGRG